MKVARAIAPWAIALAAASLILFARASCSPRPLDRLRAAPTAAGAPSSRGVTGSLALPRGGPYIIGFVSDRPATLTLDGQPPLTGAGVVTRRIVLAAGTIGLSFAAPPGARLVWHPPGRRGDPEYVPSSSLSPDPPATARFDHPGTARADALAAWALIAVLIAAVVSTRRRWWSSSTPQARVVDGGLIRWLRDPRAPVIAVFALAVLVRLWDLGAAGQTWDEDTYWSAGRNYVQNWLRGDFDDAAWRWNYEHPPVTKYLAGLGGLWDDGFTGARVVSALVMALGCALLVPIGRRLVDLRVGVIAGVIAALSPHLIAHGQIVGHEAPSIAVWMLALWASLRVWDDGAQLGALVPRMITVGVILGVALMVRFVNGLAAPAIGATILIAAPPHARRRAIGLGLAIIPAVAIVTAILIWPRLWGAPIAHTAEAWAKLKGVHSGEPFFGRVTNEPPAWYFLAYLGATTPLAIALAAVGGGAVWARRAPRRALIALVWLVAPLGVMLSPVRQDGVRYVLPMLAVIALVAAVGVDALARWLGARAHAIMTTVVPAVVALYLIVTCARVHPYYLDYYGEQVGGPAAVARSRRFELAWWGEGVADAIDYVNRHAAVGDRVHRDCVEPAHLTWFRGDLWEPVHDPAQARWIVHYQPSWRPCPIPRDAVRVYRVEVAGAPMADVYRREVGP